MYGLWETSYVIDSISTRASHELFPFPDEQENVSSVIVDGALVVGDLVGAFVRVGVLVVGALVGGEVVGAEETHTPLQGPSHWLAFALHQSF